MNITYKHLVSAKLLKSIHIALGLLGAMFSSILANDKVELTQASSGKSIIAELLKYSGKEVTIKLDTGKKHTLNLESLTPESVVRVKEFFENQAAADKNEYLDVNKIITKPLFSEEYSLWSEPAEAVAKRLSLRIESTVETMLSYRSYTKSDYVFLGTRPYCVTLYGGEDGKTTHLSLVFANKGDFGSKMGRGEDHFKKIHPDEVAPTSLDEAIKFDVKVITSALSVKFGEPVTQYFGEKEDRRKVQRWDWRDHSFVLSELDEEYVSLLILPAAVADAEGKVKFVKDSEMREIIAKNVRREVNGDVYIANIPMVDQGPKGYCAPATMERAMRYMGVPADMYLLAVSATDPEKGTNTRLLRENCMRIIRSKARSIREIDIDKKLKVNHVKKYIDKGVPILWGMRSLEGYNQIVNSRTKERNQVEDFTAWASTIEQEAEVASKKLDSNTNHHICMIIGYNESTQELAVSDSWGKRYELRWVHVDIAAAVSSQGSFIVNF